MTLTTTRRLLIATMIVTTILVAVVILGGFAFRRQQLEIQQVRPRADRLAVHCNFIKIDLEQLRHDLARPEVMDVAILRFSILANADLREVRLCVKEVDPRDRAFLCTLKGKENVPCILEIIDGALDHWEVPSH